MLNLGFKVLKPLDTSTQVTLMKDECLFAALDFHWLVFQCENMAAQQVFLGAKQMSTQ
jgi:hypothetical protein